MTRLWGAARPSLAEGISREALSFRLGDDPPAVFWGEDKGLLFEEYCRFKAELEKYCTCGKLPLFIWVLQNNPTQPTHT